MAAYQIAELLCLFAIHGFLRVSGYTRKADSMSRVGVCSRFGSRRGSASPDRVSFFDAGPASTKIG